MLTDLEIEIFQDLEPRYRYVTVIQNVIVVHGFELEGMRDRGSKFTFASAQTNAASSLPFGR